MPIFVFPDDAAWNEEARAVEFGVEIGEYKGRAFVPRTVFQALLPVAPLPERCVEAYHLERTRFERAVETKIRDRRLRDDGHVELTIADLREHP